jgi:hypothetical protein
MSDEYERRPIKYFWHNDKPPLKSKEYTIDTLGILRYAKPRVGRESPNIRWVDGYAIVTITHNKKRRHLRVARIASSTFLGSPPDPSYTADHKFRNRSDDRLDNIRWLDPSEQIKNQDRPETYKSAFIIVNDTLNKEMTVKEWTDMFKKPNGESYHPITIARFAREKKHGFCVKEYPDLEGEIWKPVIGSENKNGRWEVSNMSRMKYITEYVENVFSGDRLGLRGGYPIVKINGKNVECHVVVFKTWFPDLYAAMKPHEMILHEKDDRLDFRPEKLRIGTPPDNGKDAHKNGKYDGTKSEYQKCASYIDGVFEKEHESQHDAAKYLKENGWPKASSGSISQVLLGKRPTAYGRTWKNL